MKDGILLGGNRIAMLRRMQASLASWLAQWRGALHERPEDAEIFRHLPLHG
jgi:hypothetical protein